MIKASVLGTTRAICLLFNVTPNSEANVTLQGNFSYFRSEYNNFEKTKTSKIALFGYNSSFILRDRSQITFAIFPCFHHPPT